jgi:hypothetical protein
LNPIYYLGGSPCAGKSSVAEMLTADYGLRHVRLDDRFGDHMVTATPPAQPALASIAAASCDEIWMIPPTAQVRREIHAYVEEFPLHLNDIAAMDEPLLLEGAALLPCLVVPRLSDITQAVYMLPTAHFQREHYAHRHWVSDVLRECSNPAQAFENWMQRDMMFGRWVRREAWRYGFKTIVVDGTQSITANAEDVAAHFGLKRI